MQHKWGKYSRDLCNSRQMLQATCTPHFIQVSQKITARKLTKSCQYLHWNQQFYPMLLGSIEWFRGFPLRRACQLYLPEKEAQSFPNLDKLKRDMGKGCSERLGLGKTLRNLIWVHSWIHCQQGGWTRWSPTVPSHLKLFYDYLIFW